MSIETHKEPKRALSFRNILLDPDHLCTMRVMSSKKIQLAVPIVVSPVVIYNYQKKSAGIN
jgi:hypothetical protein